MSRHDPADDRTGRWERHVGIDDPDARLGVELWRFQHILRSALETALEGSGFSVAEYCVLELVRVQPGITATGLATQLTISRQALGRTVAQLQSAGMLMSTASEKGPSRPIHPTDAGVRSMEEISESLLDAHRRLFAPLSSTERATLIDMIRRCSPR